MSLLLRYRPFVNIFKRIILMIDPNLKEIFDKVIRTIEWYTKTYRKSTQFHKYTIESTSKNFLYDPNEESIQESLLEHVWWLPVLASLLYPYLNNSNVNLWETLIMLSIHDIGELITWDIFSYSKTDTDSIEETQQALKLLDPLYHWYYNDIENQSTANWKFAKSLDKMIPDIIDYLCLPEISHNRYRIHAWIEPNEIVTLKRKKKIPYMTWNPFISNFHEYILRRLEDHLSVK